jgi:nuclear transport factor 2 (NTF2) superfamily protein
MIAENMDDLSKVIRDNWNMLPDTAKPIANKWTKELAYRLMNQVYDINSNSIL